MNYKRVICFFFLIFIVSTVTVQASELFDSIKTGEITKIKGILEKKPEIVNMLEDNRTPLHEGAGNARKEVADVIIELLLSKGGQIDSRDSEGKTPLYWAIQNNRKELVELLISSGADVNVKDNSGKTPLHISSQQGRKEISEILINKSVILD